MIPVATCQHCGTEVDKQWKPTGNSCYDCKRKRHIINTARLYKLKKDAKSKRPSGDNLKGLPKD